MSPTPFCSKEKLKQREKKKSLAQRDFSVPLGKKKSSQTNNFLIPRDTVTLSFAWHHLLHDTITVLWW